MRLVIIYEYEAKAIWAIKVHFAYIKYVIGR